MAISGVYEKLSRYQTFKYGELTIKNEIRNRIREYYYKDCNSSNIASFYGELFSLLGFYEAKYLSLNLFLENNVVSIIKYLKENKTAENIRIHNDLEFGKGFVTDLLFILRGKNEYTKSDFEKYIFLQFCNSIGVDSRFNIIADDFLIIKTYGQWLVKNVSNPSKLGDCINSFYCFVCLWPLISYRSINTKGIILYNSIIEEYKHTVPHNLYRFLKRIEFLFGELFVSIIYLLPLIDKRDLFDLKPGYIEKQKQFVEIVNCSELIESINANDNYLKLLTTANNFHQQYILEKTREIIKEKIDNYELPTDEELIAIKELGLNEHGKDIRQELFQKLYRFECI